MAKSTESNKSTRAKLNKEVKINTSKRKLQREQEELDSRRESLGIKEEKTHTISDYIVLAFIAIAGIAILILLASYFVGTGQAVAAGAIDTDVATDAFSSAELFSGTGTMKCNYLCSKEGGYALVSSVDGITVENNAVVTGDWTCLCAK